MSFVESLSGDDIRNVRMPILEHKLKRVKDQNRQFLPSISEELKQSLRRNYCRSEIAHGDSGNVNDAFLRSRAFWSRYELVNRVFDPDDPVYSIVRAGVALSTTADNMTFVTAAAGQVRILELIIGGEATSSAVNRVTFARGAATTTTTPTALSTATPEKFNSRSPVAAGSYGSATTASIASNGILTLAFNAFGGFVRWVAAPGEEIYIFGDGTNKEWLGLRSLSGTSTVSSTGIFEEL